MSTYPDNVEEVMARATDVVWKEGTRQLVDTRGEMTEVVREVQRHHPGLTKDQLFVWVMKYVKGRGRPDLYLQICYVEHRC